ncbi:MAG TPA: DUF1566 domain-containing protein [Nitrospinota bacterium]|jgi:hypothetical protein|nr:DUF1566 domain-containing protein [Nitrospinota bacterium]
MKSKCSYALFIPLISILFLSLSFSGEAVKGKSSQDGRYVDNGDGTVTDYRTELMWTQKDSYADLGECRNWYKSEKYVSKLKTGGYTDWRMPTVEELKTIFEKSKSNTNYRGAPSRLDPIFAPRGAWWYWVSNTVGPCCARGIIFDNGKVGSGLRRTCGDGGVRAVRLGD